MTVKNKTLSYGLWVTALLSVVALVLCLIMMSHSLNGSEIKGCIAGSSCDSVLGSRWSLIFNIIPVSAIAAGVYLAVIVCCIYLNLSDDIETRNLVWKTILVLAGAIIGSAGWFTIIQIWIIDKFCPYCISTHLIGVMISVLIILHYFREFKKHGKKIFFNSIIIGLVLALIMASTQMLTSRKSDFAVGTVNEDLPKIDVKDAPIIGKPDARYVVTLMFDYQCSHCKKIHSVIDETIDKFDGDLAFVLCPTPLSPECNKYLPMTDKDLFAGSCDLTKIALAVWRCDRDAFYEFDKWLFSGSDSRGGWYPRTVDDAKAEAERMVGTDALNKSLSDLWIADYMSMCFNLFGRTTNSSSGGIPRLVYGSKWLIPDAVNADEMSDILKTEFNLSE
jgi:uncharacterized membrane protein/protein-disulfide isomerase